MENLTLKLHRTEVPQLFNYVSEILRVACLGTSLSADNYFHFHNVKSLIKKLFTTGMKCYDLRREKISLRVNVNEFESLKFLLTKTKQLFSGQEFDSYNVILQDTLAQLDKKSLNLQNRNNFLL